MERILRLCGLCVVALVLSGFDYSKHNIPVNQIRGGGPPCSHQLGQYLWIANWLGLAVGQLA